MLYSFRLYYIQFTEVEILRGLRTRGWGPGTDGQIWGPDNPKTFGKYPKQPLHARISFTNQIFWKRIMSFICHSYVLVYHLYVIRMYSYVIRVSLVCTAISSVYHSYVLVYHSYVIRMWFYHEPFTLLIEDISGGFQTLKCILQISYFYLQLISLKLIYFNKMLITYKRQ